MDKYTKVEKLLSNYKMYCISIENMEQDIKFISKYDGLKGISYEGVKADGTNKTSDIVSDTVLGKMEKIHFLERSVEKNKRRIDRIDRALEGLEDVERDIVVARYIDAKQWWQVAAIAKYSERHCKRIRTETINKLVVGIYGESCPNHVTK